MPTFLRFRLCAAVFSALACGAVLAYGVARADDKTDAAGDRIARLIEQLGNDDFFAREQAQAELAKIGVEAFDALTDAELSPDIEIAARAKFLLRRMRVEWIREGDSAEVQRLLKDYDALDDNERGRRVEELVRDLLRLPNDEGLSAACRLVRFERSPVVARQAAIAVVQSPPPEKADWQRRRRTIDEALRRSPRPGAQWLRTMVESQSDAEAGQAAWARHAAAEEATLSQFPDETQNEFVLALLQQQALLLEQLDRGDDARAVMRKMVELERGDPESLSALLEWLSHRKALTVIDELVQRFGERFDQDPALLYALAEARQTAGDAKAAEETAEKAFALNPDNPRLHWFMAARLKQRGLFAWAEKEYRFLIDMGPAGEDMALPAQLTLAEMLHDQEQELKAANVLEAAVAAMDEKLKQGTAQYNRPPGSIRSRMHYFFACHLAGSDSAKQIEHLDAGIKQDPTDADVLIALYRLPKQDEKRRKATLSLIKEAADVFRQQIEQAPEDVETADSYNQLAWLIGNTEGDQDEALRASKKSVELLQRSPETRQQVAGYLDTLGRCYFAHGDLENAIKYQSQAVDREPHSGQMSRQLQFFRKMLAKKGPRHP